jgi:rubrerythrin
MDLNRLRRLAEEVDEEHRDAMRTMADDLATDLARATRAGAGRRAFLRGGLVVSAGAVSLAVGPLVGAAAAADATTTTAPPKGTTADDAVLLAFAQSVELAAVAVYDAALASNRLSAGAADIATLFRSHHKDHAGAHAALAGKVATGKVNKALVTKLGSRMTASNGEAEWLKLAYDIENAAAATYTALLGSLSGIDPASTVASIQPIEARHAVVLGDALGLPLTDVAIDFEPTSASAGALDPTAYPVEG